MHIEVFTSTKMMCNTYDDTISCNTPDVLNTKTCHVIICIAHHFGVNGNFDMYPLKQVYFYVICVDLCGLNQVQNLCIELDF